MKSLISILCAVIFGASVIAVPSLEECTAAVEARKADPKSTAALPEGCAALLAKARPGRARHALDPDEGAKMLGMVRECLALKAAGKPMPPKCKVLEQHRH